jgi:hypothetical protein
LVEALCYKLECCWLWFPMRSLHIFNWPNPSGRTVALGSTQPQQKWVPGVLLGAKGCRLIEPTTSPPTLSQLSLRCGSLDVSQPFGPSWPIIGIVLHFLSNGQKQSCLIWGTVLEFAWETEKTESEVNSIGSDDESNEEDSEYVMKKMMCQALLNTQQSF